MNLPSSGRGAKKRIAPSKPRSRWKATATPSSARATGSERWSTFGTTAAQPGVAWRAHRSPQAVASAASSAANTKPTEWSTRAGGGMTRQSRTTGRSMYVFVIVFPFNSPSSAACQSISSSCYYSIYSTALYISRRGVNKCDPGLVTFGCRVSSSRSTTTIWYWYVFDYFYGTDVFFVTLFHYIQYSGVICLVSRSLWTCPIIFPSACTVHAIHVYTPLVCAVESIDWLDERLPDVFSMWHGNGISPNSTTCLFVLSPITVNIYILLLRSIINAKIINIIITSDISVVVVLLNIVNTPYYIINNIIIIIIIFVSRQCTAVLNNRKYYAIRTTVYVRVVFILIEYHEVSYTVQSGTTVFVCT